MGDMLDFATVALAGLTQASLQLSFGVLILLQHQIRGRSNRQPVGRLTGKYLFGVIAADFLLLSVSGMLLKILFRSAFPTDLFFILIGVLCATAVVMRFLYFRHRKGTELWIPRTLSLRLRRRVTAVRTGTDAFSLGLIGALTELPFSFAPCAVATNAVLALAFPKQLLAVCCYLFCAVFPLFVLCFSFSRGKNTAEIQQWRNGNRAFLVRFSSAGFLTLALFVLGFWILS